MKSSILVIFALIISVGSYAQDLTLGAFSHGKWNVTFCNGMIFSPQPKRTFLSEPKDLSFAHLPMHSPSIKLQLSYAFNLRNHIMAGLQLYRRTSALRFNLLEDYKSVRPYWTALSNGTFHLPFIGYMRTLLNKRDTKINISVTAGINTNADLHTLNTDSYDANNDRFTLYRWTYEQKKMQSIFGFDFQLWQHFKILDFGLSMGVQRYSKSPSRIVINIEPSESKTSLLLDGSPWQFPLHLQIGKCF